MKNRRFARGLAGVLVGSVAGWAVPAAAMAAEDVFAAMRARPAVPPAAAPDLVLPGVNGGSLGLTELRGRVVILDFFVTT